MCALVTGVQTCALPISRPVARTASRRTVRAATGSEPACERTEPGVSRSRAGAWSLSRRGPSQTFRVEHQPVEVVFDKTDLQCVIGRFQVLQIVVAVDVNQDDLAVIGVIHRTLETSDEHDIGLARSPGKERKSGGGG